MKKVLNVGGNNKSIALPKQYTDWEHILLDIDPKGNPDIVCDARELTTLPALEYDSIYCSHNLEHYYHHEVKKVLAGFFHVLKDDGFVFIRVPDMTFLMKTVVEKQLDIEDVLYLTVSDIPIKVRDVIYGYGNKIESSGCDFFAHKTGFTDKSLSAILKNSQFSTVFTALNPSMFEIWAIAFKYQATDYASQLFGIKP